MARIAELNEKRLQVAKQIQDHAARQAEWNAEDAATWERLNTEYNELRDAIAAEQTALQKSEAVQARLKELEAEMAAGRVDRSAVDGGSRQRNPERIVESEARMVDRALLFCVRGRRPDQETRQQFAARGIVFLEDGGVEVALRQGFPYGEQAWVIDGRQTQREIRADANMNLGAGVGLETVPEGFGPELERKMVAFGGPRNVCRVWRTPTGNPVPWPTIDDTGNSGALLAEETTIGDTLAATTAAVTFNAYKYSSKPIKMSAELLEDNAVGLGELAGSLLGERLGRAIGAATTTGTGSSQPNGIVTASAAGITTASATAITGDEVIGLVHSVDPAYRVNSSGFMMHDNVLLYVRKLKDGQGQYLWQPGLQAGVPERLLGYPITINQHMASTIATGNKTVLFGDFQKFIIREVGAVRFYRLEELYRATDQTGFVAFMRIDSDTIQSAAIKRITQA